MQDRRIAGFATLVACCHRALDRSIAVPGALDEADATLLVRLARRHRVQGLVVDALGDAAPLALIAEALTNAAGNLQAALACARISAALRSAGVDHLFLKGLTLGALAWPRPGAKMSKDIDLLVAPDAVCAAAEVLQTTGYRLAMPASIGALAAYHRHSKESVWIAEDGGAPIELHARVFDNMATAPMLGLATPRQRVTVAPGITIETFAPAPLLAYLCAHGATSLWFRLKWAADLAALIAWMGPEAVAASIGEADLWVPQRMVGAAMTLVERLFDMSVGGEAAGDWATRWLVNASGRALQSMTEPTERRLGTVPIHLAHLLFRPGVRFAAGDAVRQIRAVAGR